MITTSHITSSSAGYGDVWQLRKEILSRLLQLLLFLFSLQAGAQTVSTRTQSTLRFAYKDAPDKLVTEFTAVVTERNRSYDHKPEQKCSEVVNYKPGNYQIEINTFPEDIRNVDIDSAQETVIMLQQPGFMEFTSADSSVHEVTLYKDFGDKYRPVYNLDLENPSSHNMQIQPGRYEAHYYKDPKQNSSKATIKKFVIKPVKTTEVIIN